MSYTVSFDAESINMSLADAGRKAMQTDPFVLAMGLSLSALAEEAERQRAMCEYIEKSQQAMLARSDMQARLDTRLWQQC